MNTDLFAKYIPNFLFILLRAGIVISLLPFFGSRNFPAKFKLGFIVALALVLTPVVEFVTPKTNLPLCVLREVIFGIVLALAARFVFFAIDMAGQVMSNSIGLSIAQLFDPDLGQSTEVARLYGLIAMLILLATDAHHDLIYGFVKSYEWLPAGEMEIRNLFPAVVYFGSMTFILALKISAPVVIAMLISHILLGFIYKAAPQINIFFVAYPIYMFVGFLVMLISIPVFVQVTGEYFSTIKDEMAKVIAITRG